MKQFVVLLICLLFSFGCNREVMCEDSDYHFSKAVKRLKQNFTKQIKTEEPKCILKDLDGNVITDIEKIYIGYKLPYKLSVSQARVFFVKYAEQLIQMTNSDVSIRPYLHNYPVTINDIHLSFECKISKDPQCVLMVCSICGKIFYIADDNPGHKILHSETYEEAIRIVQNECEQTIY